MMYDGNKADQTFSFTLFPSQYSQKQGQRGCLIITGGIVAFPMNMRIRSPPIMYHSTCARVISTTVRSLVPSLGLTVTQLCLSCSQMDPSKPLQQTLLGFLKENWASLLRSVMTPNTMLLFRMVRILMSKQNLPSLGSGSVWNSWKVGPCSFYTSLPMILNLHKCFALSSILKTSRLPQSQRSLAFFDLMGGFLAGVYSSVNLDQSWLFSDLALSLSRSSMEFSSCLMRLFSINISLSLQLVNAICSVSCWASDVILQSLQASRAALSSSFCLSLPCRPSTSFFSFHSPVSSTSSRGRRSILVLPTTTAGTMRVFSSIAICAWAAKRQNSCRLSKMAWNWLGISWQQQTPRQTSRSQGLYISTVRVSSWRERRSGLWSAVRRRAVCWSMQNIMNGDEGGYLGRFSPKSIITSKNTYFKSAFHFEPHHTYQLGRFYRAIGYQWDNGMVVLGLCHMGMMVDEGVCMVGG